MRTISKSAERRARRIAEISGPSVNRAMHDYQQACAVYGDDSAEALVAQRFWRYVRSTNGRTSA